MTLEAILVIGTACVILGLLLLVPGLWWARRKAKNDPAYRKKVRFTLFGWIFLSIMLFTLFAGLTMQYFAPASYIGKLTSERMGRLIWAAVVIVLFILIQKLLGSFGILIEKSKTNEYDV